MAYRRRLIGTISVPLLGAKRKKRNLRKKILGLGGSTSGMIEEGNAAKLRDNMRGQKRGVEELVVGSSGKAGGENSELNEGGLGGKPSEGGDNQKRIRYLGWKPAVERGGKDG